MSGWVRAYHFLRADMTAGRGREPAWRLGEERSVAGPVRPGASGYHSATSWYDALRFAAGPVACVVEVSAPERLSGWMQVSRSRRLVACANAEREIRVWACECAERALRRASGSGCQLEPALWVAVRCARAFVEGAVSVDQLADAFVAADTAARVAAAAGGLAATVAAAAAYAAASEAQTHPRFPVPTRQAAYLAAEAVPRGPARTAEVTWQRARLSDLLDAAVSGIGHKPVT